MSEPTASGSPLATSVASGSSLTVDTPLATAIREGQLEVALELCERAVRAAPTQTAPRVRLTQLLAVLGSWERAQTQLATLARLDAAAMPMQSAYAHLIEAEAIRAAVFSGRANPMLMGEPPVWVAYLTEALRVEAAGERLAAEQLRAQAFAAATETPGRVNERSVRWLADLDPRLGVCVEAIIAGQYYWIPWLRVRKMVLVPPEDLFDLVWARASFEFDNGGEVNAFLPVRYFGSESSADSAVRLSRVTNWSDAAAGGSVPAGQRVWRTDSDEFALLDVREIVLASVAA